MRLAVPLTSLLLALCVRLSLAATVSGSLRGNVRWTAAHSPVVVTGDVIVEPGATLTISPGVEVVFKRGRGNRAAGTAAGHGIVVRGTLRAIGSETRLVTFRGENETLAEPSGWQAGMSYDRLRGWNQFRGITFDDGAADGDDEGKAGCQLKFCRFIGAHSPVLAGDVFVNVSHCHFVKCGAGGDRGIAIDIARGLCEYCLVEWSGEVGIVLGEEAVAEFCAVIGGFGDGLRGADGAEYTNCFVREVRGYAVSPVGGEFDLYYSRFEGCGSGFGLTKREPQATVHFENCDFINLGDGAKYGAFTVEEGVRAMPGTVCLDGTENRVLCASALVDRAGGNRLHAPNVWWGGQPVGGKIPVVGDGSSLAAEPMAKKDPHDTCIEHVGKIVDADSRPVANALVYALFSMAPATVTDAQGQYKLEGAQPGMYDLYAYAPGRGLGAQRADWGFAGERLGNLVVLGAKNYNPGSEHLKPVKQ